MRVPGLAPPPAVTPPRPVQTLPPTDAPAFAIGSDVFTSPASGGPNPFVMQASLPATVPPPPLAGESTPTSTRRIPPKSTAPDWKLWGLIGLAVYSFIMTAVAVWGWTRSPKPAAVAPVPTHAAPPAKKK